MRNIEATLFVFVACSASAVSADLRTFADNPSANSTDWAAAVSAAGGVINSELDFESHPLGGLQPNHYLATLGVMLWPSGGFSDVLGSLSEHALTGPEPRSSGEGGHPASHVLADNDPVSQIVFSFDQPIMAFGLKLIDLYNPNGVNHYDMEFFTGPDASGFSLGQVVAAGYNFQMNFTYFFGAMSDKDEIRSVVLWDSCNTGLNDTVFVDDVVFARRGAVPAPSPQLSIATPPASVTVGESFEIAATLSNTGGAGGLGGISISFPQLTEDICTKDYPEACSLPYLSSYADVAVNSATSFSRTYYADANHHICNDSGCNVLATYLLVEGTEQSWPTGQTRTLRLTVTPKQAGPLKILIRGWIIGTGTSPPVYRDPNSSGAGREQDQQGYWSEVVRVNTADPELCPKSVGFIHGRSVHDLGIRGSGLTIGLLESSGSSGSGLPWSPHAALLNRVLNGSATEAASDWHSTGVAGVLIGDDPQAELLNDVGLVTRMYWYRGMAPQASINCATAVAYHWVDNRFSDLISAGCSVVNYSGGIDPAGVEGFETVGVERTINSLVDTEKVCLVAAAGNWVANTLHRIASPAQAYNVIAVGSTDYVDPEGWTHTSVENIPGTTVGPWWPAGRSKPDVVAPGSRFERISANGPHATKMETTPSSSFAAPHVTGAIALLIDAARQAQIAGANLPFVDTAGKVDPRALKCALLTGAAKSVSALRVPGDANSGLRAWYNTTSHPLDPALGAGQVDVQEARAVLLSVNEAGILRGLTFDNISSTEGEVSWSLGTLSPGTNWYLTATLCWHAHVAGLTTSLNNLDLRLLYNGSLIVSSTSQGDNIEHIYFPIVLPGAYQLVVHFTDRQSVDPEPFALSYRIGPNVPPQPAPGDLDGDGDVDQNDLQQLDACASGPSIPLAAGCEAKDLDGDNDVDQEDFGIFQRCYSGADGAADPGCAGSP